MKNLSQLRKEKLIQKILGIDSFSKGLSEFVGGIFSVLQEEVAFHVGWFFLVDSATLKRVENSLQFWADSSSETETGPLFLDDGLFPSVHDFDQQGIVLLRGEEWWSNAQFSHHALYQKTLKPEKLFFSLIALVFDAEKKCLGYFVLWKKRSKRRFSDKEMILISGVLPAIGLALKDHLSKKVTQAGGLSSGMEPRLLGPLEKVSGIGEEELYSLIRRRAQPGILILDHVGNVLYLNHDGKVFLKGLTAKSRSFGLSGDGKGSRDNDHDEHKKAKGVVLPEIVSQLYTHFSKMIRLRGEESGTAMPTVNRICIHDGMVYLLRALLLQQPQNAQEQSHFMILIEKVSQGVRMDQIDWSIKLTPRESEVVQLLLEGKTNKEVAVCIDIGEYTVKDHIKRIMKKLEVSTRAGIVAKVLQHHFPS